MRNEWRWGISAVLALAVGGVVQADVKPAGVFGDNMVLQRDIPLPVWGTADPGEQVTVSLLGQEQTTTAGEDGSWRLTFQPIEARNEPFEVTIRGNNQITLRNVLAGDVWICSGQSNMQWTVGNSANATEEIAAADYPQIRLYQIPRKASDTKVADIPGLHWRVCAPNSVRSFSAVGYFFGRHLNQTLNVPIGLIDSSWGGTLAEAWTDRDALAKNEMFKPILDRYVLPDPATLAERTAAYEAALKDWQEKVYHKDTGISDEAKGWAAADLDESEWKDMHLPQTIEAAGLEIDGAIWFRKTIDIPAEWAGKDLLLEPGRIDDFDTTFFNGVQVGTTGKETPNHWNHPRKYTVPGEHVKAGRNVIAIRVFDHFGGGGINNGPLQIAPVGQTDQRMNIEGDWKYRIERAIQPVSNPPAQPTAPVGPNYHHSPGNLYNGMIHPLVPFGIKGAIWYQGESNAGRAEQYRELLPAMIANWREAWGQGDFPFLIVQLANYMAPVNAPVQEGGWPELREAQMLTAKNTPNTGLAVIIDIGEAGDIHPRNKQDVGKRLGLAAEKIAYGRDIVHSGPTVSDVATEGNQIVVTFDNVGSGLEVREKEGRPLPVGIAGEDGKFVQAQTKIEDNRLIAWSDEVAKPVALRYAWSNNPDASLLYNKEGLPASPFRTDDFPMTTAGKR